MAGPGAGGARPVAVFLEPVRPLDRHRERTRIAHGGAAHVHRRAVEPRRRRDRGPLRSEPHDVLAGEDHPHGAAGAVGELARGDALTGEATLPPNAPPLASGDMRVAARARTTTRRAPGTRVRPTRWRGARRPSRVPAARAAARARRSCAGPAPCPRARGFEQRLGDHPLTSPRLRRRSRSTPAGAAPRPGRRAARRRRRSRRPPGARATPTRCDAPPSSAARRAAASRSRAGAAGGAPSTAVVDGLPAGAAAQVRGEGAVEVDPAGLALRRGRGQSHHDPRRAEPALRTTGRDEARREIVAHRGLETLDRQHRPARDARHGRDARDARLAVDQHRATPALTLRCAPVLGRDHTEPLAQHREQRLAGRHLDLDLVAVARELHPMPSSAHGQAG